MILDGWSNETEQKKQYVIRWFHAHDLIAGSGP
jgi:hypothetical protein